MMSLYCTVRLTFYLLFTLLISQMNVCFKYALGATANSKEGKLFTLKPDCKHHHNELDASALYVFMGMIITARGAFIAANYTPCAVLLRPILSSIGLLLVNGSNVCEVIT